MSNISEVIGGTRTADTEICAHCRSVCRKLPSCTYSQRTSAESAQRDQDQAELNALPLSTPISRLLGGLRRVQHTCSTDTSFQPDQISPPMFTPLTPPAFIVTW
jgi:hypothetical protein